MVKIGGHEKHIKYVKTFKFKKAGGNFEK